MFDTLSERLGGILDRLTRRGALSEADLDAALREVRRALLEADVALDVARAFTDGIKKQAIGVEVMKSVTPGQMVVKIVHDQLVATLGADSQGIDLNAPPPVAIMMVGLQGSGKTTTTAKVARRLTDRQKKKVLMASLDVRRPAAMEQLAVLGRDAQIDTLPVVAGQMPPQIARRALEAGRVLPRKGRADPRARSRKRHRGVALPGRSPIEQGLSSFGEAEVVSQLHGREPELCRLVVASNVHVNRLGPIAREEEEPIGATPQDGRAHGNIFAGSARGVTEETVAATPLSSSAALFRPLRVLCGASSVPWGAGSEAFFLPFLGASAFSAVSALSYNQAMASPDPSPIATELTCSQCGGELHPDEGFRAGRTYRLRIVQLVGGRELFATHHSLTHQLAKPKGSSACRIASLAASRPTSPSRPS